MKKLLFALFFLWPSLALGATTVYIGDNSTGSPVMTFSGTLDALMVQTSPTTNAGAATTYDIQNYSGSDQNRLLIKFTGLSSITGPVTVQSATLWINMDQHASATGVTLNAHRLLRVWVEGTATWNIYDTALNWTTAGASSDGNDRIATVSATATIATSDTVYHGLTGTQLANDVENIINGINANNGWVLTFPTAVAEFKRFVSSENASTSRKPYLEVTYTTAGGGSAKVRHQVIQ